MITVGPYRFSARDATSTVGALDDLLDLYPPAAQGELDTLRRELRTIVEGGEPEAVIGEVFPRLLAARDAAGRGGTLPPTATGTVAQLSVSDGGVPKAPVDRVEVDFGGVTTDRQGNRKHHGRPFQALCLWSAEIIDGLAADGHPIFPGAAGENLTISGLDWPSLTMGTRLATGSVVMQVTAFAVPCAHQRQWFTDGDFSRLHHDNGDISRLYATVIEPGSIATGDEVVVEAPATT
ncbi:MAG: MOSC domain-containing protein [Actinomycetota bacterium]